MLFSTNWRTNPSILEINTWVWLRDLADKHGRVIDLSSIPETAWDKIASYRLDAVWLMGVWQRSPMGREVANHNAGLLEDFRRALPDFVPKDNVGSPYCIRDYVVDDHLGGPTGLVIAREELARRGMRLILDFVPNHVAPDHRWVTQHPEYFIQGTEEEAKNAPGSYLQVGDKIIACGKDPYFPAWPDVVQLNIFSPAMREAATKTMLDIAAQCDGVRCDMAMLLFNSIFERTWGGKAGPKPETEYWIELIRAVKQKYANFLFIAEAYWDLEWDLQQQGFDYCYDKRLYDRLLHESAESVRQHLAAGLDYQSKLIRFIENHDEPRAADVFSVAKEKAAAVAGSTLPGAKLFHEGQFEGRKIKLPVFLGRRPAEAMNTDLQAFYLKLTNLIASQIFHEGEWRLDESGWVWSAGADSVRIEFPSGRVWLAWNGGGAAENLISE